MRYMLAIMLMLSASVVSAQQQRPFNPMDSIMQGYELGERMDRTQRGLPPPAPAYQPPISTPSPQSTIRQDYYNMLLQQELQRRQQEWINRCSSPPFTTNGC